MAPDAATTPTVELDPPRSFSSLASGEILPHRPLWCGAAASAGGTGYDLTPKFADAIAFAGLDR